MANRSLGLDRNHSFVGNFSVLEGVMVKISDKFKPPKKVTLPVGWQPVDIKNFDEFDFTLEEEVIKMADQEKLQQEREKENLKVAELMLETDSEQVSSQDSYSNVASEIVDTSSENTIEAVKSEGVNRIEEAPILEPVRIQYGSLIAKGSINKQSNFNFSEFEDNSATPFELVELQTIDDIDELKSVLQPNCVKTSVNSKVIRPNTKTADDLDFSIFNTPVTANIIKTSTASPVVVTGSLLQGLENEDSPSPQNAALSSESQRFTMYRESSSPGMLSWGNSAPLITCYAYGNDALSHTSASSDPVLPLERRFEKERFKEEGKRSSYSKRFYSTLDSTYFLPSSIASVHPIQAPTQPILPISQNSDLHARQYPSQNGQKLPGKFTSLEWSGNVAGPVRNGSESSFIRSTQIVDQKFTNKGDVNDFGIERTNLNKSNSKSLPNLAEAALVNDNPRNENLWNGKQRKSTTEVLSPVVSTSRIDNIMKQFQLNRLREFDEVPTTANAAVPSEKPFVQASMAPDVNARVPSRHGNLPSLQTSPRNITYPPIASPPHDSKSLNSLHANEKQCLSDDESNRRFGHLEGANFEKRLSLGDPLPSITTPSPHQSQWGDFTTKQNSSKQKTTSWLPDPFSTLSASEQTFVTMISSMGFPKARTSRAVLRLKNDEKEIIDFLVRVQQIVELGFDEDDAEMALIDNNNDKEKALSYLNLVNKWKELGFPIQRIHSALSHTNKENEAVFEYLTT